MLQRGGVPPQCLDGVLLSGLGDHLHTEASMGFFQLLVEAGGELAAVHAVHFRHTPQDVPDPLVPGFGMVEGIAQPVLFKSSLPLRGISSELVGGTGEVKVFRHSVPPYMVGPI